MSFKDELISCIQQYEGKDIFGYGNIPPGKRDTAIQNFPIDTSDEVLCLVDATVFGSCKNGMAIGLKGLYWKNSWTVKSNHSFFSWQELAERKNDIHAKGYDVILSKNDAIGFSGSNVTSSVACNLIKQSIDIFIRTNKHDDVDFSVFGEVNNYSIVVAKFSAILATESDDVNGNVIELATQFIDFDENISDKSLALSTLESEIERLNGKPSALKNLNKKKVIAELKNYEFSPDEKEQIQIIISSLVEAASGSIDGDYLEFMGDK